MSSNALWVFVNRDSPNESIQIHDQASADALKKLLKETKGSWEVREQLNASVPSKAPIPLKQAPKVVPTAPEQERRSHKRYMTEFRVILISGSHSFRSITQDISLGGIKLKKSIPSNFIENNCIAYISHKDLEENLELICNVIADPSDPCRIQFQKPDPTQLKRLNEWLQEQSAKPLEAKAK